MTFQGVVQFKRQRPKAEYYTPQSGSKVASFRAEPKNVTVNPQPWARFDSEEQTYMKRSLQVGMMILALGLVAVASDEWQTPIVNNSVPEIDGASAATAVALVAGGLVVVRSRRRN